jgi:hypothetical protein
MYLLPPSILSSSHSMGSSSRLHNPFIPPPPPTHPLLSEECYLLLSLIYVRPPLLANYPWVSAHRMAHFACEARERVFLRAREHEKETVRERERENQASRKNVVQKDKEK